MTPTKQQKNKFDGQKLFRGRYYSLAIDLLNSFMVATLLSHSRIVEGSVCDQDNIPRGLYLYIAIMSNIMTTAYDWSSDLCCS